MSPSCLWFLIVSCQYYTNFTYFWQHFIWFIWTNLLIQCLVLVPIFCMVFVSQKIHIKWSPNAIKFHGELFWNICDFWELESPQTEAHTSDKTPGRARGPWHVVVGCALLERRLELYFGRKEAYIQKKNHVKISAQSELRISRNIRNGFRPDQGSAKQKRT